MGVEPVVSTPMPTTLLGLKTTLPPGRPHRLADRLEETLDVIGRVLPGQVGVLRIDQHARLAAGIVGNRRGHLAAVGQIDHQGPNAVGAVIHADGIPPCRCIGHKRSSLQRAAVGQAPTWLTYPRLKALSLTR